MDIKTMLTINLKSVKQQKIKGLSYLYNMSEETKKRLESLKRTYGMNTKEMLDTLIKNAK